MSHFMKRQLARCAVIRVSKSSQVFRANTKLQYSQDSIPAVNISSNRKFTSESLLESKNENFITVTTAYEKDPLVLHYIWLRDHCQCDKCFNNSTKQRSITLTDIPLDIRPEKCQLEEDMLIIKWEGGHLSQYHLEWLRKNSYGKSGRKSKLQPILWKKNNITSSDVAHVDIEHFMNSETKLSELVLSVLKYGIGFVENVPATLEATERVARRVTHVQRTFFGDMWEFSASMVHSDTAYTTSFIGAHTDGTYLTESPGIQVFHCLCHDGDGGETLLVDGFRAASEVKEKHPESYDRLCNVPQGAEYIEKGKHYMNIDTVLKLHPVTKHLHQIRFNMYDRSPLDTVPHKMIPQFYTDIRRLSDAVTDPAGELWLKLSPGTILFIDNWRILHGRASYTGYRKMGGCYLGRADFISKARVLNLV